MSMVILDAAATAKLSGTSRPVAVFGPDGKQLGYFTPAHEPEQLNLDPGISDEEIRRRMADKTVRTYTTEEVLAKLEDLRR